MLILDVCETVLYEFLPMLTRQQVSLVRRRIDPNRFSSSAFALRVFSLSESEILHLVSQGGGDEGDVVLLLSLLLWKRRNKTLDSKFPIDNHFLWYEDWQHDLRFLHRFLFEDGFTRIAKYCDDVAKQSYEERARRQLADYKANGIQFDLHGHDDETTELFRVLNVLGPRAGQYSWFADARSFLADFIEQAGPENQIKTSVTDTELTFAVLDLGYPWGLARPTLEFLATGSRMAGHPGSFPAWTLGYKAYGAGFRSFLHESLDLDNEFLDRLLEASNDPRSASDSGSMAR